MTEEEIVGYELKQRKRICVSQGLRWVYIQEENLRHLIQESDLTDDESNAKKSVNFSYDYGPQEIL